MEMNETMWKLATPVLSYIGTALVKMLFTKFGSSIPSWLKPVIAGLLGTAVNAIGSATPTMAVENGAIGFALGGGAPMVNEVVAKVKAVRAARIANA